MSNTASVTRASRYGKFRPYSLRATGGFSDVYLARDGTGRTAALKIFRTLSNDSTNSMERFRREKTILERVGSRRVARLIDADLDATPPWIASEFINGPTLREAVNQSGPFDVQLASSVLSLLAETLDELHELGVAHRDLNPNNVVLSDEGPTLIDFGSAQLLATGQASYSKLSVGTPGYISPEQLNGDPATLSSDIYAFAKMAIYLVTGDSTEHTGKGLAKFGENQRNVLLKCLSVDPLERPTSRELRNVFESEIDAFESLRTFKYSMPDLKRLPRGPLIRWLLTITVLASALGALGIWRATTTDQLTTDSVIQRINNDQQKVGGTVDELKVRSGNFGAFDAISLPTEFGIDRQRRNFGESEFGFLEIFKIFVRRDNEKVNFSDLVVYTLPSAQPPSFDEVVASDSSLRLVELPLIGTDIAYYISRFQAAYVEENCALQIPSDVSIDFENRRIRHVAAAPICTDDIDAYEIAFAVHDWYPDKNLLFQFTGWALLSEFNPLQILDSVLLAERTHTPVVRPSKRLLLPDISIHGSGPSLIDVEDGDSYFYANTFVEIPARTSLSFQIEVNEDSSTHLSFTAYRQESKKEAPEAVPAGRFWAVNSHQLRFDNPDSTPMVLSIEIDSDTDTKPKIVVETLSPDKPSGWLTASTLSFGVGTAETPLDPGLRLMLPSTLNSELVQTVADSVGSLAIRVPSQWFPTTSDESALAGFREYWPTSETLLREGDLPHLRITSEEFSRQLDGSEGSIWVTDPAFSSCRYPVTFSFTGQRTVQWSIFWSCSIDDVNQSQSFARQIQASPIFKFVMFDSPTGDDSDEATVAYRGVFVPGTHQDLDYFRSLLVALAEENVTR